MIKLIEALVLSFIPIFVAVDAIGNIPLFISLVDGTSREDKHRIIIQSVTTATVVAIIFMFIGKFVLRLIGITMFDFQIAGGILLFFIATRLLIQQKSIISEGNGSDVGVFPLGTPLITGPAVLTTIIMMLDAYGIFATFVSLVLNMFIVWVSLVKADTIMRILGANGTRAFAKIIYILLAAIGVMMVRRGVTGLYHM